MVGIPGGVYSLVYHGGYPR